MPTRQKTILTFIIFILIVPIFANLPDFKRIVEKRKQAAEQKAQLYSRWMDHMREDTREMDNYDVRYYFIDISINFDIEYVEAIIESHLEIVENNVSEINFHFTNDLTVDNIQMNGQPLNFTHDEDIIAIELGSSFQSGDIIELSIQYYGYPQNRLNDGMKFQEHNGVPIVFTMVSPRGARKWWPCKDTPADKPDSLDIWITYPSQYICASNGALQEVVNNGNGTSTSKWHESYPVCTYLTSFAITNYQMYSFLWEYEGNQMMVDNYVYPEQYTASVSLYGLCGDMLTFYCDVYGEYPFISEKYGHATCTNLGALAMEHQTCTSFDSGYISDPDAEYTVAHELSHQWAGDCLSIGSWSHVWLKEGFTSYSEALWAEHLYGEEALHEYMLNEDGGSLLDECLYRDENGSASHIFNWVVYAKGSWTLHMLRGVLGDELFFQLMHDYMQNPDFIYGNVLTEDLKNSAETVSGQEMDWFFDEWFYNYGRPRYKFVTYTSEVYDSLKTTLFSEGSHEDPFFMYVPYILNGNADRFWAEDGFNYYTSFMEGELDSLVFDPQNWVLDYGYLEQVPVLEEVEVNREGAVVIVWEEFFDSAIEGFNIYRKEIGGEYIQLNSFPISGTFYFDEDVEPGVEYFYKIAAVFDSDGNYISKFSNEISIIPVDFTFDQGILLVDGTLNSPAASPFPTDEEVDNFYDEILSNYDYSNWDLNQSGAPPIEEIAKYSSIIWHTDDIINLPVNNELYNIKSYLLAGGNLLISCWKMLFSISDNFYLYYLYFNNPDINNNPDFTGAFGELGFPDISVDTDKVPLPIWEDYLPYINKFEPIEEAEAIYRFDSATNDPNWENEVCAQRYIEEYKVYILGFPLYFIEQSAASQIVNLILQDFGEPTDVDNIEVSSERYSLINYPNPFKPETTIKFTTENTEKNTELTIYNIKGQKVRTLYPFPSGSCRIGTSSVVWNGTDENNQPVSSGIYFYKLKSGKYSLTKKMILMK